MNQGIWTFPLIVQLICLEVSHYSSTVSQNLRKMFKGSIVDRQCLKFIAGTTNLSS